MCELGVKASQGHLMKQGRNVVYFIYTQRTNNAETFDQATKNADIFGKILLV